MCSQAAGSGDAQRDAPAQRHRKLEHRFVRLNEFQRGTDLNCNGLLAG